MSRRKFSVSFTFKKSSFDTRYFPRCALLAYMLMSASFSVSALFAAQTGALNIPPPGFSALFNGQNLDDWWGASTEDPRGWMKLSPEEFKKKHEDSLPNIAAYWRVENGELINAGRGLYLTSVRRFRDYELLIDYKAVANADSGIYLKGCPQVQIWDYTKEGGKWALGADKGSGGLWNNSPGAPGKDPLVRADKPFGQWNHCRIIQCGSRTWVWLNQQLVVDGAILENYFDKTRELPIPVTGAIQLQTHGGEIRWRNIFVRDLPSEEANRLLRNRDSRGFEPVFNHEDFEGWTGAVGNYAVVDGAIMCRPQKGGTIYTEKQYSNFALRLEVKLSPGGNNGLAIRYPGEGDAAYVGMCEIQVLDDGAPQYTGLDPRQFHGSVYGMVAAKPGYLRPVGEWNYEEVTVNGSTITVELNGSVILSGDLSKVTEFLANRPHPGKDRTSGSIGFAGHKNPVMFRNIFVKTLP